MDNGIDLQSRLELRDNRGRTVGFVELGQLWEDLLSERDRLRTELDEVRKERDDYYHALEQLTGCAPPTFAETEEVRRHGMSAEEMLRELGITPRGA